jgi:hypothetical protein
LTESHSAWLSFLIVSSHHDAYRKFEKGITLMARTKKLMLGAGLLVAGATLIMPATSAMASPADGSPAAAGGLLGSLLGGQAASAPVAVSSGINTAPSVPAETDQGDVAFTVNGSALPPGMNLTLQSVDLTSACTGGNTLGGMKVATDFNGNFTTQVSGRACVPGTYNVEASEASSPYQTFSTTVTIAAP